MRCIVGLCSAPAEQAPVVGIAAGILFKGRLRRKVLPTIAASCSVDGEMNAGKPMDFLVAVERRLEITGNSVFKPRLSLISAQPGKPLCPPAPLPNEKIYQSRL
jgi:hypothetical protein